MGVQLKVRGKLHVRLNMTPRPIANKYREGKLKRTLKREFKSTSNCVVVNGGVLEVGAGGSGWRLGSWGVLDPQGLCALVALDDGCISPALHATNRWDRTEAVDEVQDLCLSAAFLAPGPAGS